MVKIMKDVITTAINPNGRVCISTQKRVSSAIVNDKSFLVYIGKFEGSNSQDYVSILRNERISKLSK